MDIFTEYQALPRATSEIEFSAVALSPRRRDFLAKNGEGAPVFLLHDSSSAHYTPGVSLKNLSVQFHNTCRVVTAGATVDDQFALLACDAAVPELHELFVRCVGAAVEQLSNLAGTRELEACVRGLLNLFRAMNTPGGREVAGLWAELFVISRSGDIPAAVLAWHADNFERFDFSWPDVVLEVKATQGQARAHEFALDQLVAPGAGAGVVASLLLQPLTNGTGVMDLANEIGDAVAGQAALQERLWSNVLASLGSDFGIKLDRRFDLSFAERNVVLFSMSDIPCLDRPNDARISSIRFRVDLTTVTSSVSNSSVRGLRDLFGG